MKAPQHLAAILREAIDRPEQTLHDYTSAMTLDENTHAEGFKDRLRDAAPDAATLINDRDAMAAVINAWSHWNISRIISGFGPARITAPMIFGASKGMGRSVPGLIGRVEKLRGDLAEIDELAAAVHLGFAGTPDENLRLGAKKVFDAIGEARDQITDALAALYVMTRAMGLRDKRSKGGTGALSQKAAVKFEAVADEVAYQWRQIGLSVPKSNARDGGFIDLLDALHREAGAGPLKGIPALMAHLR